MRTRWMAAGAALAVLGLGPPPVAADSVEGELVEMQQRLEELEVRLQAASEELAASNQLSAEQQALLEGSGIAGGASSGLASFLDTLEFGGWVNASYWYNTNDPDNDDLDGTSPVNPGAFGSANRLNPDSNAFTFDQLWFSLERPVDAGQRAGFGADLLIGEDADVIDGKEFVVSGDDLDWYIHQAYAQYLADFGNGIHVKAGKFSTLIGHEVIQSAHNDQISRGIVWQNFQPIDHVGILLSTQRRGWEGAVGYVNGFDPNDLDTNDGKTVIGRVGYTGENYAVMLNGLYGPETPGDEHDKIGLADLVLTFAPNDQVSLWVNGDFLWADPSPCQNTLFTGPSFGGPTCDIFTSNSDDAHAWGVAVGGRVGVTDRTGFSLRGEYLQDDGALITGGDFVSGRPVDATLWSVTGTVDHKLTDNLIVRGEVRWDKGRLERAEDNLFVDDSGTSLNFDDDDQILVGIDITYLFN